MNIDLDKMIEESRQLHVSLYNPNTGEDESYVYYIDTPGICIKLLEDGADELVDFDFIPEYVTAAVVEILKNGE